MGGIAEVQSTEALETLWSPNQINRKYRNYSGTFAKQIVNNDTTGSKSGQDLLSVGFLVYPGA
jgi:hypothetical protein